MTDEEFKETPCFRCHWRRHYTCVLTGWNTTQWIQTEEDGTCKRRWAD